MLQWLKQRLVPTADNCDSDNDTSNINELDNKQEIKETEIHFFVDNEHSTHNAVGRTYCGVSVNVLVPYYNFTFMRNYNKYTIPAAEMRINDDVAVFYLPFEPDIVLEDTIIRKKGDFSERDISKQLAKNVRVDGDFTLTVDIDNWNIEATCIGAELYSIRGNIRIEDGYIWRYGLGNPRTIRRTLTRDYVTEKYGHHDNTISPNNHALMIPSKVKLGEVVDYNISGLD